MKNNKFNNNAFQEESLEQIIDRAIQRVNGEKENDLCKYIPVDSGGYIHHFTMRKMKRKQPTKLASMIETFIIKEANPRIIPPKQRAPRGLKKTQQHLPFSKQQIEKLLTIAKNSGDTDMIAILSPKKSLAQAKKELILSIKREELNEALWNTYAEVIQHHQAMLTGPNVDEESDQLHPLKYES